MPQLDFITYWIFCPIYYILMEWHVILFIFVSLVSFFFFSYKFYSKEINLMGLAFVRFCMFIYNKFLLVWFSLEFFFFTQMSSTSICGLLSPNSSPKEDTVILGLITRIVDYWIVAIQGGFGIIIKWLSILIPGNLFVWIFVPLLTYIFGTVSLELQIIYGYFALAVVILCFRFGLWEPTFIWNVYDKFNNKPLLNEWEDVELINIKPWHLNTFYGIYIIFFSWIGIKLCGMWALPCTLHAFPNDFMNQDLVEFEANIQIYARSYLRQPMYLPLPQKWEVVTKSKVYSQRLTEWLIYFKQSQNIKRSKRKTMAKFFRLWNKQHRLIVKGYNNKSFKILEMSRVRREVFRKRDQKVLNYWFNKDPVFRETRKRHKFFRMPFLSYAKIAVPFITNDISKRELFMEFLSYPHLWSNRLVNYSDYYSNLYNCNRKRLVEGRPLQRGGNKWYISGYLVDVYQKQLIDLKKLYKLYWVYSSIINKTEKRMLTIPEFRVLVEFSVKPFLDVYDCKFPQWNDLYVTQQLESKRIQTFDFLRMYGEKRGTIAYTRQWNLDYKVAQENISKLELKIKLASKEFNERKQQALIEMQTLIDNNSIVGANTSKEEQQFFKKQTTLKFFSDWRKEKIRIKKDLKPDIKSLIESKIMFKNLENNPPLFKTEYDRIYLTNWGSDTLDPLSVDLDLRFVEWHPIIGFLNKDDFVIQSEIKDRIAVAGWDHEVTEVKGPLQWQQVLIQKPFYNDEISKNPGRYNHVISFAAQKNYDYWFAFYQNIIQNNERNNLKVIISPMIGFNSILSFDLRAALIKQDLSTRQLMLALTNNGLLHSIIKENYELTGNYEVRLPEKDWFFNLNPMIKVAYPKMCEGFKFRTDLSKNIIFWFDQNRQGLAGVKLVRHQPEGKISTYGGIPLRVLEQRMRRRLHLKPETGPDFIDKFIARVK